MAVPSALPEKPSLPMTLPSSLPAGSSIVVASPVQVPMVSASMKGMNLGTPVGQGGLVSVDGIEMAAPADKDGSPGNGVAS